MDINQLMGRAQFKKNLASGDIMGVEQRMMGFIIDGWLKHLNYFHGTSGIIIDKNGLVFHGLVNLLGVCMLGHATTTILGYQILRHFRIDGMVKLQSSTVGLCCDCDRGSTSGEPPQKTNHWALLMWALDRVMEAACWDRESICAQSRSLMEIIGQIYPLVI
jgi:hypothetical protein